MDKIFRVWVVVNGFLLFLCFFGMLVAYDAGVKPDYEWTNFWLGGLIFSFLNIGICGSVAMSHYIE
jgi:hypothetical protein